jgi:hypothetical protein
MKNRVRIALLATIFSCLFIYERLAPTKVEATAGLKPPAQTSPSPTPTPSLNDIQIGHCYVTGAEKNIEDLLKAERRRGLVMDARPFAVNQSVGKVSFEGGTARVSVVNMNPFVYNYKISVAQQEIVNSAITDFLKLLLPDSLKTGALESGKIADNKVTTPTKLKLIEARLNDFKGKCSDDTSDECRALNEMYNIFDTLRNSGIFNGEKKGTTELDLSKTFTTINDPKIGDKEAEKGFTDYLDKLTNLKNEDADAYTTCKAAEALNKMLADYQFDAFFAQLDAAQQGVTDATNYANDLGKLADDFNKDTVLKKTPIRCKGYNCADQFMQYSQAAQEILGAANYQKKLDTLRVNAQQMQQMAHLTDKMKSEEGLFARTFTVPKKFELSQATISINRTSLTQQTQNQTDNNAKGTQSGTPSSTKKTPTPSITGGTSSSGTAPTNHANGNSVSTDGQGGGADTDTTTQTETLGNVKNLASDGQVNEGVMIGRQRFTLSGGLVYSPLPRRTFKSVKGFTKDAQGNPTGDGSANIVGFDQNSSRRLLPMVFLNSRLTSFKSTNIYFSVGVTAKHDDGVDIEYLFGPSVGLLNNRVLFTFGAYAGSTEKLVSDVKLGDELPDGLGNAKLYRKGYTWKPGFSFSYNFASKATKEALASKASGDSKPADELNNEIHIGSIPFNLAVGFAYTSLEQRTYDAIVGFARDRQGKLTNGQTLTRIVGLTSSSNYRLTPLAMLHSRLTHFSGGHDFYFSTGVTGKKTDNDFDIEYMLGGSINLYQRKVFLTLGVFAGKQQVLGGNFFEGAKLGQDGVTTENRYVWKPAVSISYDISRIVPGH